MSQPMDFLSLNLAAFYTIASRRKFGITKGFFDSAMFLSAPLNCSTWQIYHQQLSEETGYY